MCNSQVTIQQGLPRKFYPDAAIENGSLLGLAGYNTTAGALTGGGSMRRLGARLVFFSTLRAIAIFALFERKPTESELVMDGIAVSRDHRGKGVGGQMLDAIIQFAVDAGYKTVRLDVIDTNPLAKKLYERKGFKSSDTQHFPYLK